MADVTPAETTETCCAPEQQATCCEPSAKAECCGHGEGCGCDAGSDTSPAGDVREQVRERYAAAARAVSGEQAGLANRLAISDVIAGPDMDDATRADMQQWTGCIAGALTRQEFEHALTAAGLIDVQIHETHHVREHAAAAIIRAHKPAPTA